MRLDPDQSVSALPPPPSSSSPHKANGHHNGDSAPPPASATTAPIPSDALHSAIDVSDEEEPEENALPEEEDLSRRDMYLDTVRS